MCYNVSILLMMISNLLYHLDSSNHTFKKILRKLNHWNRSANSYSCKMPHAVILVWMVEWLHQSNAFFCFLSLIYIVNSVLIVLIWFWLKSSCVSFFFLFQATRVFCGDSHCDGCRWKCQIKDQYWAPQGP